TDEAELWPSVARRQAHRMPVQPELVALYSDRASVPREVWLHLLMHAREHIDLLVFSGTFFQQSQPRVAAQLAARAKAGAEVRLCFGTPDGEAVATRDAEEGLNGTLSAKIRASLTYYRDLATLDGCCVRLHNTPLYTSMFRYDQEIIVNPHTY